MLFEAGLLQTVTVFTESGVIGGLPAPGVFFGAAACPKKLVRSAEVFRMCGSQLDVTLLGVLEADSEGNVNVSRRGQGQASRGLKAGRAFVFMKCIVYRGRYTITRLF